ncbi:hydantoinase/oxoprolinase N-terminal domain-containing protein [Pseudonocardia sp. HH130630-07]|uniref:hydantoinase/oxoprolinase N-terminal domain-containing protein n=1 Tax=Pseudonocardia sp. HH130630-07 TaxID=1690815 RepID=UPI0008150ACF|nr:hydantoinase/oxoprolinase family protein [Pseudonocardia sp. HH130630-07]ANY09303.1 hydantoinase subunit beta [Pseudonocardia sp. HH130630-07]
MTGRARELSVGIDVGGTNTDAVVLDGDDTVLAWTKQPTTADVTGGVRAALRSVLGDLGGRRAEVSRVMLGTTHATNAIVRRRDLGRIAVVRLGAPASGHYPPLVGWPDELRATVLAGSLLAGGGHLVDGYPISPLDPDGIRRFLDGLAGRFDAVAVCGIFGPSFPDQELEVAALVHERAGVDVPVSLSHEIGPLGLLERENATVLNAALHRVARDVTGALVTVVAEEGLDAAPFFAQNDGTLMTLDHAARYPVLTIGSGPANSIRGAARLSGADDAIVVDVGGTTSDLGVLNGGFPRESTLPREIGGVRTNFRMPDVLSLGVGGGTVVDTGRGALLTDSVGHRITTEALLFGGPTATLTDAAALAGPGPVTGRTLPPLDGADGAALRAALEEAHDRIGSAVERMSLGRVGLPLVVVGGGGFLVPDRVPGAGAVVRPDRGDVANAVGAAIALAGGRADRMCEVADRAAAIDAVSRQAVDRAVHAGADPRLVEVVDVLETPVSYSARPTLRVSVKAAGPLARTERRDT